MSSAQQSAKCQLAKSCTPGVVRWTASWDGGLTDFGYAIAAASDSDLYVAGSTSTPNLSTQVVVRKYCCGGTAQWHSTWGGAFRDEAFGIALAQTDCGLEALYAVGLTTESNGIYQDVLINRYDPASGALVWSRIFGASGIDDRAVAAAPSEDGGVYLHGYLQAGALLFVAKYDLAGNQVWIQSWSDFATPYGLTAISTTTGETEIYACGHRLVGTGQIYHAYIHKFQESCGSPSFQWDVMHGNAINYYWGHGVAAIADGVYLSGKIDNTEAYVARYSSSGVLQWTSTYTNGPNRAGAFAVSVAPDGGAYVTGGSDDGSTGNFDDVFVLRYDPFGGLSWTVTWSSPGNIIDIGLGVATAARGDPVVTTGYGNDLWVLRCSK